MRLALLLTCLLSLGAAGSLALGASRAEVERRLGPPAGHETRAGFDWGAYTWRGHPLELGFYRDMLGRARLTGPLTAGEADAAARAFVPGYRPSKLHKDTPTAWHYAEQLEVKGAPFEAGLIFRVEGGTVTALDAELNWLD